MLCLRRPNNPFCRLCFAMLFFHPQIFFQLGLDFLAGLQRCDFWTDEKSFLLTTAAQNMHILLRKSPLCWKHFFERLKTKISSTACGTSTLKSLLLLGSNAPHVHLRLRKRLTRCTLWRRNFCAANFPFSTASNMRHLCRFWCLLNQLAFILGILNDKLFAHRLIV